MSKFVKIVLMASLCLPSLSLAKEAVLLPDACAGKSLRDCLLMLAPIEKVEALPDSFLRSRARAGYLALQPAISESEKAAHVAAIETAIEQLHGISTTQHTNLMRYHLWQQTLTASDPEAVSSKMAADIDRTYYGQPIADIPFLLLARGQKEAAQRFLEAILTAIESNPQFKNAEERKFMSSLYFASLAPAVRRVTQGAGLEISYWQSQFDAGLSELDPNQKRTWFRLGYLMTVGLVSELAYEYYLQGKKEEASAVLERAQFFFAHLETNKNASLVPLQSPPIRTALLTDDADSANALIADAKVELAKPVGPYDRIVLLWHLATDTAISPELTEPFNQHAAAELYALKDSELQKRIVEKANRYSAETAELMARYGKFDGADAMQRLIGDPSIQSAVLGYMAVAAKAYGRVEEAQEKIIYAIDVAGRIPDADQRLSALLSLGVFVAAIESKPRSPE